MTVTISAECVGCGLCVETAAKVFKMDGEVAVPISPTVSESETAVCKEAAEQCPVNAIKVSEA